LNYGGKSTSLPYPISATGQRTDTRSHSAFPRRRAIRTAHVWSRWTRSGHPRAVRRCR